MKKVLFASTALIATASVAAADIKFSGYGRFGIGYQEDRTATRPISAEITTVTADGATVTVDVDADVTDPDPDDTILISRFRLNIDGTAETDGGVEFFARVRLQADENSNGEAGEAGLNGALFSVIYGGLRVDAGNVAGSFSNLPNYFGFEPGLEQFSSQYSGVDFTILDYTSTGAGANAVFFQYAVSNFTFSAAYDQQREAVVDTTATPSTIGFEDGDYWDIGASYTFDNITVGLAYGQDDFGDGGKDTLTVLTVGAEFGDFSGTLFLADDDTEADDTNGTAWGLSASYNVGAATTLQAVYGDGSADEDTRNIGIGAIYDLGGGASLRGGVGEAKTGDGDGRIRADFGAQFNF